MDKPFVNGLRWTADGQAEKESIESILARMTAVDQPATPAVHRPLTPEQWATMSPAEVLAHEPYGELTDAEASHARERDLLQREIDARANAVPPSPAVTFTAEQRAAASPADVLNNGSAVDEASAAARRAEIDQLRQRAAS